MGIIQRFSDIMSANINALLDRAEDPSKMIDQYLRNLQKDLEDVKEETAAVMAEEKRCERELKECNAEIAKLQSYAEKAILAGNDNDAKQFLMKKTALVEKQAGLQQAYEAAAANSSKMKQMYDKLCSDISTLNARKDAIKAKVAVAKTQEKINKIGSSMQGAARNLSAFDRMEAKANQMLDKANAMAELNSSTASDSGVEDLMSKYDAQPSVAVEDELAALKAKLGK
ncbi:MAG: PspA/IM30 family protein [Lachnospiraceae bacterium]|nr:PspA/IM30 family protein [Lachnospiraceae bacterium]